MKQSEVQEMLEAGLVTREQAESITAHFNLKQAESGRFLTIVLFIGAALVALGIILLIGANWDAIPRGVKIASGITLLLGAYAGGWLLRESPGGYSKSGEALYVLGAGLFLGNIALIGQIYHLTSRVPNAFLLWWVGIAVLPWLLRSKGLHVLSLAAFCIWFGTELNERNGPLFVGDESQFLMYPLIGLVLLGIGYLLRGTAFREFAPSTERVGLGGMLLGCMPLMWGLAGGDFGFEARNAWVFPSVLVLGLLLVAAGCWRLKELNQQWKWTWLASLAGLAGLVALAYFTNPRSDFYGYRHDHEWIEWVSVLVLFIFSLVQIQTGVQLRSRFMVNTAVAVIAISTATAYIKLFGSMTQTGLVFLVGGVFLIGLGVYLEKQRRALVKRIGTLT